MMKPLILCALGAALWLGIVQPSRACKYCQMAAAAADPDGYRADTNTYAGGFPLDASIDKFQPAAPPAPLKVVTSAADLPKPAHLAIAKPTAPAAPAPVMVKATLPAQPAMQATSQASGGTAARLFDGSLLGLAAMGGVFFWRTRRPTGAA